MTLNKKCRFCSYRFAITRLLPKIEGEVRDISPKEIIQIIITEYKIDTFTKLLSSNKQNYKAIRDICVYMINKYGELQNKEIAIMFNISSSNITRIINITRGRMNVDRAYYNEIIHLEMILQRCVSKKKSESYERTQK